MKNRRAKYEGVQARYDAARRTPDTASLWRGVDSLSVNTLNSPDVRRTIRDRARYEVANNSILSGIVDTYVTDLIGAWVTVQFPESGIPQEIREAVIADFDAWCCASRFWQKLRLLIRAKVVDGEAFALFYTDKRLAAGCGVTLNLAPIECDRVESWTGVAAKDNEIDGIRFDEYRHPVAYRVLKYHPGDYRTAIKTRSGDWISADWVLHYFDQSRPEQVRGVSDLVACLELPAKLRSYTNSVIESASRAAEIAGVLETDQVPECWDDAENPLGRCATVVDPNTVIQAQRGAIITLPEGWRLNQLRSEQPTSTYPAFKREIISEIGRCLAMPYNIAACDSSSYNYASGRLDHITYDRSIDTRRAVIATDILDRVFFKWLDEWLAVNPHAAPLARHFHRTEWLFTKRGNADPMKDANANDVRLKDATVTYSELYARDGKDWKREVSQALAERAAILAEWRDLMSASGLPPDTPCPFAQSAAPAAPSAPAAPAPAAPAQPEDKPDSEDENADEGRGYRKQKGSEK